MSEPLGDRQGDILVAIVSEFIKTADPVGSKHLVGKFNLAVSSATVRNEMARLEELGYLTQPHASAGRVPTAAGYRFFVDRLQPARLGQQSRRELEQAVTGGPADLDELLRRVSDVLSRSTHLAAAAVTPRLMTSRLRHLDVAWVGPRKAIVIVIADGGRVEKRLVELDTELTSDDVDAIGPSLNRRLTGMTIADAERAATSWDEGAPPPSDKERALAGAVAGALGALLAADQDLVVGGAANLATTPDFGTAGGDFARVYEVIERRVPLREVMADAAPPASVRIGDEVPVEDLHACGIVLAPYSPGAAIGVIGPMRMEYPKIIAMVSLMAKLLGDAVEDLS